MADPDPLTQKMVAALENTVGRYHIEMAAGIAHAHYAAELDALQAHEAETARYDELVKAAEGLLDQWSYVEQVVQRPVFADIRAALVALALSHGEPGT
jgi:hypothetical protein